MASNYAAIRDENKRKYGTDIPRIGPMLLGNRYGDRMHFIFELLQNAEDALKRRREWSSRRTVEFVLVPSDSCLKVSHFGTPFSEQDVHGICGIGESTKDLTDIGRFGIGFKSVYAITDCPEIHSGEEHFAIDSYVWPREIKQIEMEPGQTVFRLPLKDDGRSLVEDIKEGLRKINPRTLLFLREIEEILWYVGQMSPVRYARSKSESLGKDVRKVTVFADDDPTDGVTEMSETWLIFSREVSLDGANIKYVEIAFLLGEGDNTDELTVQTVSNSPLVAFFPTIVQTGLGFWVQGPYRTTLSRDNVPIVDELNNRLVRETATLLVDALQQLRDLGFLNVEALRCLPLDVSRFPRDSMFGPLFIEVREALSKLPLLPCFRGGHIAAKNAVLARTQELRELISPVQLRSLFQVNQEVAWLSEEITQDRTPELRRFLIDEIRIAEIGPETLLPKLTKSFLEAQTNEWVVQLYEFLRGQSALLRAGRLNDVPLIRLENGTHVVPLKDGKPQAFLPGPVPTGFPTVRQSVCRSEHALGFLKSLGLSLPDPVDDVIMNVLTKYQRDDVQVSNTQYQADIERLLAACSTDSTAQRNKLTAALKNTSFVAVVNTGNGSRHFVCPGEAYQATQRLKDLFQGVSGVLIIDDGYNCLRGESIRNLLESCGVASYLQPMETNPDFTWHQKAEMRAKSGTTGISHDVGVQDFTLRGLEPLLATLSNLPPNKARASAIVLWQALCDVARRRGDSVFSGTYTWFYYTRRYCNFDAAFVRLLNETAWVPDCNGALQRPGAVVFDDLEPPWEHNPILLSKIRFKPPIIDQLAKEAGIEPGVLDLLKKIGLTSEAELRKRLGIKTEVAQGNGQIPSEGKGEERGEPPSAQPSPPIPHPVSARGASVTNSGERSQEAVHSGKQPKDSQQHSAARRFVSYVAVDADEEGPDPDGVDHQERLTLEEKAIALVLSREPQLKRMPTNNPGFDLIRPGPDKNPVKLVEVKAMTGTLQDRPVGLSKRQFECAQEYGEAYWLYVVEHAGSPEQAQVVRIQDPAGKARTFTFDSGWLAIAEITADKQF